MTENGHRALLVINPNSRRGGDKDIEQCTDRLRGAGFLLIVVESKSRPQTEQEIAKHASHIDLVILAGGDGTISSSASALYQHQLTFAILPMGTANDLARSLGIPDDLQLACDIIIEGRRRRIDLGTINGHFYFNAAHIGLGVNVTYELTPEVKKTWGVFSYLKALFAAFARSKEFYVTVNIDGFRQRMRSIHLAIGNGRFYGGGNVIHEDCSIDDGRLYLYSLKPQPLWQLLTLAPLLHGGHQSRLKRRIFSSTGRRIEVRTSPPMEIHADGEPVARTPAVFEVVPAALEVIAPPIDTSSTHFNCEPGAV